MHRHTDGPERFPRLRILMGNDANLAFVTRASQNNDHPRGGGQCLRCIHRWAKPWRCPQVSLYNPKSEKFQVLIADASIPLRDVCERFFRREPIWDGSRLPWLNKLNENKACIQGILRKVKILY